MTYNELRQVVGGVPLLSSLRGWLYLWGFTVQVCLSQRLHETPLSTHKCLCLMDGHGLIQIGTLGGRGERGRTRG